MEETKVAARDWLGDDPDLLFLNWDLTEVQEILNELQNEHTPDFFHAERLQQRALRCADILSEYMGKMVKVIAHLEAKVTSTKAKEALNYKSDEGRTTLDMKKWAADSSEKVLEVLNSLASAKGFKVILDRRYEIIIKAHHHYKEIAAGLRKTTALGHVPTVTD